MRALVVDGDVTFAAEVSRLLRPFASVETSHDGAEALAALRSRSFDVVIVEWLLPSVDGISLLRSLRESGSTATCVMCTVLAQREAREHALAAGATEVLIKPVSAAAVAHAALGRFAPGAVTPGGGTPVARPSGEDDYLAKFTAKAAWRDTPKTLVRALAAATGRALQESAASADRYDSRTTLAMVDVRSRIRLELGMFTTIEGGRDLVRDAIRTQDPQPDEITEFMSEMCNQTLGAVKSAMRIGGMQFTLLVPRTRFVQPASGWGTQFPATQAVHIVGERSLAMLLVLGARSFVPRTLDVAALRENMVLSESISDDEGTVLAEAATRLTAHVLVRLKLRAAGQKTTVAD
jgi:CheY-like chemotaxis protein